ncbi:hypothetical protein [Nostoc sp. 106C]|uniref:hypothetical protein n=1 Tax=Nostoc sp. 106C TaxID=1932667 RepID=UPI000A3B58CD|nr:hypothetical protein [Nostoc sp. 106C]OUL31407.1 hypothetical protein BV375_12280 [Nostoc sp. 106C]
MKYNFPVWQITVPLSIILTFGIGSITAIYMTNGGYIIQFEATPQKVNVRTVIDKRNNRTVENDKTRKQGEINSKD